MWPRSMPRFGSTATRSSCVCIKPRRSYSHGFPTGWSTGFVLGKDVWDLASLLSANRSHFPVQTERWRIKLQKVFALAGRFEEPPVPHRFRHTFVRILLERGVPVGDVAELVGDTERVLLRYYAKWIPSRQARLTSILKEAFDNRPEPITRLHSHHG